MACNTIEWATWMGAVGTILVALVAIWQDWIRASLFRPKLKLQIASNLPVYAKIRDSSGSCQGEAWYWHLEVVNDRPKYPAEDCRVILTGIQKKSKGEWQELPFGSALEFRWAHSERVLMPVVERRTVDFGAIEGKNEAVYKPCLCRWPYDFAGSIGVSETVRYHLKVEAKNFYSKRRQTFEVKWDGKWSPNGKEMAEHCKVTEFPQAKQNRRCLIRVVRLCKRMCERLCSPHGLV